MEVMWWGVMWFSLSPLGLARCKACHQHALCPERVLVSCVTGRAGVNEEPEWHPGPPDYPSCFFPLISMLISTHPF